MRTYNECLLKSTELTELAATATSPDDKAALLAMAAEWRSVASTAMWQDAHLTGPDWQA